MKLGDWIKDYRTAHGLSLQAFADLCGFSKAYAAILEKGTNPTTGKPVSPTMQTFENIAKGVGIDVNEFIAMLDKDQTVTLINTDNQGYYLDPEAAKMAQELYDNPGMRILFDAAKNVSAEDLKVAADLIARMKKKEEYEDD